MATKRAAGQTNQIHPIAFRTESICWQHLAAKFFQCCREIQASMEFIKTNLGQRGHYVMADGCGEQLWSNTSHHKCLCVQNTIIKLKRIQSPLWHRTISSGHAGQKESLSNKKKQKSAFLKILSHFYRHCKAHGPCFSMGLATFVVHDCFFFFFGSIVHWFKLLFRDNYCNC